MTEFRLDPRLEATSAAVGDLTLCHVRLSLDSRWPWLVLIPRRPGLVELTDVAGEDRTGLWGDLDRAAAGVRALAAVSGFEVGKLNVAALGNVVPQLHLHVIGRNAEDAAWPGPVWAVGEARPYASAALDQATAAVRSALTD